MADSAERNWWILRVLFGAVGIAAGTDKFLNLLVEWPRYLWSFIPEVLNVAPQTYMYFVGIVEILVGIAIFTRFTKYAAYVLSIWLLGIATNLLLAGYYDIAVRDVGLAVSAFVLGNLSPAPDVQAESRRRRKAATT